MCVGFVSLYHLRSREETVIALGIPNREDLI